MDPDQQREFEERMEAIQRMLDGLGSTLDSFSKSMNSATTAANKATTANTQTAQASTSAAGANTKLQQAYAQADQEIGKSGKNIAASFGLVTSAAKGTFDAFGSLTKTMLSAQEGFGKYGDTIGKFGDAMSSVVKDVPVLGAAFAGVTKILTGVMGDALKLGDQMISLRDNIAGTAGALPATTTELTKLASNAKYFGENMEKLSKITAGLGQNLTSFGQTAGQGATRMMELAAVTDKTRNEFRNLGYSQEQLTKLQSDYVSTLAQSGNAYALQNKSMAQLRKESLEYALQINRLSSLTGKNADQLEDEKQQIARARGFQLYAMQEQEKAAQLRREGRGEEASKVEQALVNQVNALQQISGTMGVDVALRAGEALRTPGGVTPGSVGIANMAPGAIEALARGIQSGDKNAGLAFSKDYGTQMRGKIGQTQSVQDLMSPETLNALGFYESAVAGEVGRGPGSDLLKSLGIATADQKTRMSGAGDEVAQTLNNLKNAELQLQEAYQNFLTKILPDVSNGLVMVAEKLPELANQAQELWDKMGGLTGIVEKLTLAFAGLAAVSVVGPIVSGLIGGMLAGGVGRLGAALFGGGAAAAGAAGASGLSGAAALAGKSVKGLRQDSARYFMKKGIPPKEALKMARNMHPEGSFAEFARRTSGAAGEAAGGASKLSKLGGLAKGAGKLLGKLAWPLAAGVALYDAYQGWNADPNASFGGKMANAGKSALSGLTFGLSDYITGGVTTGTPPPPGAPGAAPGSAPNSAEQLMQQNLQNSYLQAIRDNTDTLKKVNTNLNTILGKDTETAAGAQEGVVTTSKLEDSLTALAATVNQVTIAMGGTPPGQGGPADSGPGATFGGDIDRILGTIRARESGGGNPAGDYKAENPTSTASGAYQFTDGTWRNLTSKYGIGTEWSHAADAPAAIQDQVAAKYIQEILGKAGGDISKVPLAWFTGNIQGRSNAVSSSQVSAYQSEWMKQFQSMPATAGGGGGGLLGATRNTTTAMQNMGANITGQNAGSALMLARSMLGANEKKDRNTILQYLRAGGAGLDPGLEAWCAAFVNSSLQQAGISGSGSAVANSFQNWGSPVSPNQVMPGDVVLETRGLRPGQPGGHVGLATGAFDGSKLWMIAGNTGNKVQEYPVQNDSDVMIRRASMMKAARGGIFSGPKSGYPMELHGTEIVAPLSPNSLLMELGKMPANVLKANTAGVKEGTLQIKDFQRIVNRMAETQTTNAADMIKDTNAPLNAMVTSMEKYLAKANQVQSETLNMLSYKIDEMIDSLQTSNKHTKKIMKKAS